MRQYNPKKPKKWGYKIFMLCSGESGIVHQIEFYLGKSEESQSMTGLSNSASVVARLSALVPVHKNYKMFRDNWFSSVPLLVELKLKGILSLCTYQPHRIPSLNFPADHHIKKNHGREHMTGKSAGVNGSELAAVKWLENKGVHLLSNFAGSQPQSATSRYNRKTKTYDTIVSPNIVKVYNKFMGGIDSFVSFRTLLCIEQKLNQTRSFTSGLFFIWCVSSIHGCCIDVIVVIWAFLWKNSQTCGISKRKLPKRALLWCWNQTETVLRSFSWSSNKMQEGKSTTFFKCKRTQR